MGGDWAGQPETSKYNPVAILTESGKLSIYTVTAGITLLCLLVLCSE